MEKGWRIAMAVASLGLAAAAIIALFTPLIVTEISYGAWGLEYKGSSAFGFSNPGGGAQYDESAFDDDAEGRWLRAVAPLLIGTAVVGLLAGLSALFPRVAGILLSGIMGGLAVLLGGGAMVAIWQGSDFADGADSLGDLAIGAWLVAATALAALIVIALAWIVNGTAGIARMAGGPTGAEEAAAPAAAKPTTSKAVPPRVVRARAGLAGRSPLLSVTLLVAAAALAIPAMLVRLASAGHYRYHAFGYHYVTSSNWRHGGSEVVTLMVGGIWLGIGAVAAVALAVMYAWWRAGHDAPPRSAWVLVNAAAGIGLLMGALVLGTGLQMLKASESATIGTGMAWAVGVGVLALGAYVPAWVAAFKQVPEPRTT